MYTVSDDYETYVKAEARNYSLSGTIVNTNSVTMTVTRDNILEDSFSFSKQCVNNNSFGIGSCAIGSMEITLQGDYHHSLYNAEITLQQGIWVTGDSYHMQKIGTWIIKKAVWNGEWVTLTCYDKMYLTQKKYSLSSGTYTPYALFSEACTALGITLATTQAEIEAMTNGTQTFTFNGSTQETDRKWSDVLSDMCAAICGFCTINRFGNMEVHQFGRCYKRIATEKTYYTTAVDTLTKDDRITGGAFGNGAINITGIYINDRASTDSDKSILVGDTTGTTLNLGYNRWLSSATSDYDTYLQNIVTQLAACQFYAADVHLADVSLYDLGDLITLETGGEMSLSSDILMCVMDIDYNFADESTISSYTFSESSSSSTSSVESNLTNRIESLENAEKEVYCGTSEPSDTDGNDGNVYYEVIEKDDDTKTLEILDSIYITSGAFNTAYTHNLTMSVILNITATSSSNFLIGAGGSVSNARFIVRLQSGTTARFEIGGSSASADDVDFTSGNVSASIPEQTMTLGSETLYIQDISTASEGLAPLLLNSFNQSTAGGVYPSESYSDGDTYYHEIKIYESGTLVRDFIPVINVDDTTDFGFFDTVNRVYYDLATYGYSSSNVQGGASCVAGDGTGEYVTTSYSSVEKEYVKIKGEWIEYTTDSGDTVEVTQTLTSGTEIATISVNSADTVLYAPTPQNVSASQTLASGTEVGSITVDNTTTTLYAPTPQSVSVTQTLASGTEIGSVTIDDTTTTLYAPSSSGGSTVTVTPITTSGTNIANIDVDGTTYQLFAPSSGGGGSGDATVDLLFENTDFSVASGTSNVSLDYTLSASIDDYDAVIVSVFLWNKGTAREQAETIIINKSQYYTRSTYDSTDDYKIRWAFLLNGNYQNVVRSFLFGFADNVTLKTVCRRSNSGEEPKLYRVYGLKFGGGSSGHNYSTEEQVVGTWIDGSTLYECTYDLGSDLTLQDSTWTDSGITKPTNANRCIKAEGIQSDGTSTCIMVSVASTNISVQSARNSGDTVRYITIQYTKTS